LDVPQNGLSFFLLFSILQAFGKRRAAGREPGGIGSLIISVIQPGSKT
jgi:hypothetical protein